MAYSRFSRLILLTFVLVFSLSILSNTAMAADVIGSLDEAYCTYIRGWACDPDRTGSPTWICAYHSDPWTLIGCMWANEWSEAGVCGGSPNHRFRLNIPFNKRWTGSKRIYVYGQDVDSFGNPVGGDDELGGSGMWSPSCSSNDWHCCDLTALPEWLHSWWPTEYGGPRCVAVWDECILDPAVDNVCGVDVGAYQTRDYWPSPPDAMQKWQIDPYWCKRPATSGTMGAVPGGLTVCNSDMDCAHNGNCFDSWTATGDRDGDGDNDYCFGGIWYDCNTDAQCPGGYECSSNDCVPSCSGNGVGCSANGDCCSGMCVDGVCCNSWCSGTCQRCNQAGSVGTCVNIPSGTDPYGECSAGAWTCDAGNCRRKQTGNGYCSGAASCDAGIDYVNCGLDQSCSGGTCGAGFKCSDTNHCASGRYYDGYRCNGANTCNRDYNIIGTDSDLDGYDNQCEVCDSDPTQFPAAGGCSPVVHGTVLIPDDSNERRELYAEGTQWTPDAGDFSEKSLDSFEGSYSTHNRGSWVRYNNPDYPTSTYPAVALAYKIDVGELACLMIHDGVTWYEIAETSAGGCGYTASANKIVLTNDGHWHVATIDVSDRPNVNWIISGGAGDIYLDNVYALKNRVFTTGGTANVYQWMYVNCYDDDTPTLERSMGLINYPAGNERGYMYWVSPSSFGQYGGWGNEYSDVVSGSSNWKKSDNTIAKIKWHALANYQFPQDNDIAQYCDDGPLGSGWNNNNINFDVYACPSNDNTGDTYCPSTQYCTGLVTSCTNDLVEGTACTRNNQCTSGDPSRPCSLDQDGFGNYCDCTPVTECLDDGGCYVAATCRDYNSGDDIEYCSAGTWIEQDSSSTACTACTGAGRWNIGGEIAPTTCCGDDAGENYYYYNQNSADWCNDITEGGCLGRNDNTADDACCDSNEDCVFNGVCYTKNTGPFDIDGDGVGGGFCIATGRTWRDCDYGQNQCTNAAKCGSRPWVAGGETAAFGEYDTGASIECCGDDVGENYHYFDSNAPDGCNDVTDEDCIGRNDDTTDDACCNSNEDCVLNGVCYTEASGPYDLDGDGVPGAFCRWNAASWRDCDNAQAPCEDGRCNSLIWIAGGESATFGEYDTGTSTECCGDDASEVYESCAIGFDISWSASCTSSDDACCDSTSCVDPSTGRCYDINSYYDVLGVINGMEDDSFARCAGGGGWRDCDENSANCGGCAGVGGFPCTAGADCWIVSGETPAFGEYAAGIGSGPECCADDAGESYHFYDQFAPDACDDVTDEDCVDLSDDPNDDACCNNATDCVLNGMCYSANSGPVDIDADGVAGEFCMWAGTSWRDCDASSGACTAARCGSKNWIAGGESAAFGEYDTGTSTECCEDDFGEFTITEGVGPDGCCNASTDCVDGTNTCRINDVWSPGGCTDGIDNDCDGVMDADDSDCLAVLNGTVRDEEGNPIENATVIAVGRDPITDVYVNFTDITNALGYYEMQVIINLTYDIIVKVPGYGTGFEWDKTIDDDGMTIDFIVIKAEDCEDDCTSPGENYCRPDCWGINGCEYFNGQTFSVCADGAQKDWILPFGATQEVQCCEGIPSQRKQTQIVGVSGADSVVRVTRIISYGGQLITLVIDVFQ